MLGTMQRGTGSSKSVLVSCPGRQYQVVYSPLYWISLQGKGKQTFTQNIFKMLEISIFFPHLKPLVVLSSAVNSNFVQLFFPSPRIYMNYLCAMYLCCTGSVPDELSGRRQTNRKLSVDSWQMNSPCHFTWLHLLTSTVPSHTITRGMYSKYSKIP